MAVSANAFSSIFPLKRPYPSRKHEGLWVVGLWSSYVSLSGDVSGGDAQIEIYPWEELAPAKWTDTKLDCWWNIKSHYIYNTGGELSDDVRLKIYGDLVTQDKTQNQIAGILFRGLDNANNLIAYNGLIQDILMLKRPISHANIKVIFASNVNGRTYTVLLQGQILMDEEQLRTTLDWRFAEPEGNKIPAWC